ncbi:heavy-metal-associated domain-containing protein [Hydrogenovibrio kuenenii]|uniref:heavy-metal-associated domain-containing protein n=1 Tax=Hydrogenovibrio kuenenii TaxID=63658 RepID=UPI000464D5A0|nr:heavy metal-associated domain-containing protein [Hydrogenovibrio kuenenii]
MNNKLQVENIKCGGCANSIEKKLSSLEGVSNIVVNIEAGEVSFVASSSEQVEQVKHQLEAMGYPEEGSSQGIASATAKAKSYVSCAVGRMSAKD